MEKGVYQLALCVANSVVNNLTNGVALICNEYALYTASNKRLVLIRNNNWQVFDEIVPTSVFGLTISSFNLAELVNHCNE